jgi:hypothetical protein
MGGPKVPTGTQVVPESVMATWLGEPIPVWWQSPLRVKPACSSGDTPRGKRERRNALIAEYPGYLMVHKSGVCGYCCGKELKHEIRLFIVPAI